MAVSCCWGWQFAVAGDECYYNTASASAHSCRSKLAQNTPRKQSINWRWANKQPPSPLNTPQSSKSLTLHQCSAADTSAGDHLKHQQNAHSNAGTSMHTTPFSKASSQHQPRVLLVYAWWLCTHAHNQHTTKPLQMLLAVHLLGHKYLQPHST